MIRHIVLLKFKSETSPSKLQELETAFVALKHTLPLVQDLEWGLNCSHEGLDKGFTHCYYFTFANAADRDGYMAHPLHQAFVDLSKPWVADVLVVDFEV